MGFFKDINTLKQQGKEMQKTSDPGGQLRDATSRMADLNQSFAQANAALAAPPADAVDAMAQVVSVSPASGFMNADSIVPVELLIMQPGLPPRSVATSLVVPITQAHRLQPGASVAVKVSKSDPSALAVDWTVPA